MALGIKLSPQSTWRPLRASRWLWVIFILVIVGCLDQLTKALAVNRLPVDANAALPLVGSYITLHLTHNPGAALSLLSASTIVVTIISCVLCLVLIFLALFTPNRLWSCVLAVIAGGGLSNLVDRGRGDPWGTGAVVDFIDYFGFFVGNVADIFVVLGVVVVFIMMLKGIPLDIAWISRSQLQKMREASQELEFHEGVILMEKGSGGEDDPSIPKGAKDEA